MLRKLRTDKSGFTLIELMIVIAIIGILAAIAIPNFIAYRNKSYCSRAESDANGVASAIADFFAIPSNIATPTIAQLNGGAGYTPTGNNVLTDPAGVDPNLNITIQVTDGSGRCPDTYKAANLSTGQGVDGWVGAGSSIYYKFIAP